MRILLILLAPMVPTLIPDGIRTPTAPMPSVCAPPLVCGGERAA